MVVAGADLLVRGAANLAARFRVPPLLIGLTVVAFATSAPELVISVRAALRADAAIAIGNVVGSNIFNVLFILGASALVTPLLVSHRVVRRDVPIMIVCSAFMLLLALDGGFSRPEGAALVTGLLAYTAYQVRGAREARNAEGSAQVESPARGVLVVDCALFAGGLIMLAIGSRWFIDGSVDIATALGISQLVVGLTLVAGGTSLPELATSVLASVRGERDIAVGNIVGSNIFNILFVLGLSALVSPAGVPVAPAALSFDIPVMVAVALACLPIFSTGSLISRWEGLVFVAYYGAYLGYLVLHATQHEALAVFRRVMLTFVLPLTALTISVIAYRAWRAQRRMPRLAAGHRAEEDTEP